MSRSNFEREKTILSLLTNHARKQAQRRGIFIEVVSLIIEEADIRGWSGDGCRFLQVSRKRLGQLIAQGDLNPCLAERVNGVSLVRASDGAIVTVMHKKRRFKLRKYGPKKCKKKRRERLNRDAKEHKTFFQFLTSQLSNLAVPAL